MKLFYVWFSLSNFPFSLSFFFDLTSYEIVYYISFLSIGRNGSLFALSFASTNNKTNVNIFNRSFLVSFYRNVLKNTISLEFSFFSGISGFTIDSPRFLIFFLRYIIWILVILANYFDNILRKKMRKREREKEKKK